jgi:O-antigen ligase
MSSLIPRGAAESRPSWKTALGGRVDRLLGALAIVATGILLGIQFASPNKRVIAVIAAIIVFGTAWRIDLVAGLGVIVLTLPYPRGTVFGNSNFALILLLLVVWLLRFSLGIASRPRSTKLDLPIAAMFVSWVVSFYNINSTHDLNFALQSFLTFIACILMYVLIVNNVTRERDLIRLHVFQAVSITSVLLIAVYELNHPGGALVPGWIYFNKTVGTDFGTKNVRVGGPFFNYELLSEYCALSIMFVSFLFIRARSLLQRTALGGLFVLCFFILFATVTRGAMVALGVGVLYLLYMGRRHLKFIPMVVLGTAAVLAFLGMDFFVGHFTRSGDLMARFSQTYFVGLVPDSRVGAWQGAWKLFLEHPIIGRGPYYPSSEERLSYLAWPHNLFLYTACLFGIIGVMILVWLLVRLFLLSRPTVDTLRHPSYSRAFLMLAHAQLLVFIVDETKIEFLRSSLYPFQIWLMFAAIVAAERIGAQSMREGRNLTAAA